MNDIKDEMLTDAIKTAIDFSYKIIKLKIVIGVMSFVIIALTVGYFI